MGDKPYLYLMMIGVAPTMQGRGFGRVLVQAVQEQARLRNAALYLETETPENVAFYEHMGFTLLSRVTVPIVNLPMWEMVWEPD